MTEVGGIAAMGLSLKDFAIHDPVVQVVQAQKLVLADAKKLADRLRNRQGELKELNEQYKVQVQALRAAQDFPVSILETAADAVISIDEKGTIDGFYSAAERMFGYSQPEVMGRNGTLLMGEPHASKHSEYIRAYLESGISRPRSPPLPGRGLPRMI